MSDNHANTSPLLKIAAILALALAVAYVVAAVALSGSILLIADTFLTFMAAFCFAQSQFLAPRKAPAKHLLAMIALLFLLLALLLLVVILAKTLI